ncbi:hypothetical protein D915_005290 [Fasciola hepatica]|uniref:C2H2-type domain-containing protein n=1 Tax=Fasciola hepatica TaxID=6192 RepID=A0A4E0RVT0_FASHE|nr:hypothetical protein D915_005290 [Fasciola hepatica]
MQKVKPDPDGAANIPETPTSGSTATSHDGNAIEEAFETSVQSIAQEEFGKTSASFGPLGDAADERQQTDKHNSIPLFRSIAPKPCHTPVVRFHPVQTVSPDYTMTSHAPLDADGFISFGGYERYIPYGSRAGRVPRSEYANTVVPHQNLHVSGQTTLRLYQVVPKSRTTLIDPQATSSLKSSLYARRERLAREHEQATLSTSDFTSWNCSHLTTRSKLDSSAPTHASVNFSASLSDQAKTDTPTSDVVLNVNRLRPSAELLTRLGRQLVESQYKRLTVEECGCGKVRHFDTPTENAEESSELLDDATSEFSEDLLAVRESTHLEWRKKPEYPRWNRVRALCSTHQCPFIPSTMFQFHRHLEQGHQRMMRCVVHRDRKPTSLDPDLPAATELALPLIISPHSRTIQRVTCPVCPDFQKPITTVIDHIDRAHPFISASLFAKPFRHFCGICGIMTNTQTGSCRRASSGSYVHYSCSPNTKNVRYAAWANCDAHSLACLMLNPNRHSRLSLSESMVRQLYHSMDYVLSINTGRSRLWTVDTFTLRCTLAVSSLFGELIHIPSRRCTFSLARCDLNEINTQTVPTSSASGSSEPRVVDEMSVSSSSSAPNSPPQTRLSALETLIQPSVIPASGSSEAVLLSVVPALENHSSYPPKRLHSSFITSEPQVKVSRVTADEETPVQHLTDEFNSQQTILVDLTNGDSSEVVRNGSTSLEDLSRNSNDSKPNNPHPSHSSTFIRFDKPSSETFARIPRVLHEVCELCDAFVRSCRQHLIEKHGDHLVNRLKGHPIVCPSCPVMFVELSRFLSHGRIVHQCLMPKEVCDQLPMDRIPTVLRGAALLDLRTLQTHSKHSLRKRTAVPAFVPPNIVTYHKSVSNLPMYSCSVCASAFVSLIHLDLHTTLAGHQYWCALCPFACRKGTDLISHHSAFHQIIAPNVVEPVPVPVVPTNCVNILPKPVPSVLSSILPSQLSSVVGQAQSSLAGHIHPCNMCPVFCLTLEDLNLHRTSVHKCSFLSRPQNTNTTGCQSPSTSANGAPTVIIASGTTPISSTLRQLRPTGVQRTRVIFPNTTSGLNTLLNIRQPVIVRPQNPLTSSTMNFPIHSSSIPSAPVVSSAAASMSDNEDLACPMCDFQSRNRAEVMQHIVDAH